MLKKAITYQNLDGVTVTEEFHFQITKAEVAEKALVAGAEYAEQLRKLTIERDGAKIIAIFKELLTDAVGKREGNLFLKNDDIRNSFMFSGAYDSFFMELLQSPDSGAQVIVSMFPSDMAEELNTELKKGGVTTVELPGGPVTKSEVDGIQSDAEAQAAKPQPQFSTPAEIAAEHRVTDTESATTQLRDTLLPTPSEKGTDDDPAWLKEGRNPTRDEMRKMSKEDLQFAFKLKESGVLK